jgi:uncharacterized protein (DUF302 family)
MSQLAIQKNLRGDIESVCLKVSEKIKEVGFGVLTRIDFDQKLKEKLGADIEKTVILGACNPKLAYAAYQDTKDISLFVPCNIVVRETSPGEVMVEAVRPTAMMSVLPDFKHVEMLKEVEAQLKNAIESL